MKENLQLVQSLRDNDYLSHNFMIWSDLLSSFWMQLPQKVPNFNSPNLKCSWLARKNVDGAISDTATEVTHIHHPSSPTHLVLWEILYGVKQ